MGDSESMQPESRLDFDLAAAVIAIGAEACFLPDIPQAVFKRLVELGMARMRADEWELTAAGKKILEACAESDDDIPGLV